MDGGRSRPDREKLVSLHPNSDDFPIARQMDPDSLAKFHEFSEPAKETTLQWILEYANKLINASITAKQSVSGDNVSEANVNEAAYSLNRREDPPGYKKLAGVLGGIFLGTGISTLFSIVQAGKYDRNGIILMAVSGILGAFLVAVDLPQSIQPRWRRRSPSTPPRPSE